MRQTWIALLLLLPSPAVAKCVPPSIGVGGPEPAAAVSDDDRREIEALLGTKLERIVCSGMLPVRPYGRGFGARRGFFVLTAEEALFVADRKVKAVLFRAGYGSVREVARYAFGARTDGPLFLELTTDAGRFRLEFSCHVIARSVVAEFERRTPVPTRVVSGSYRAPLPASRCS